MKVQYQKSAARKGFQAEQVSRANVQQILNQGEREAQQLRTFAESDIRERKRQSDALQENYEFERRQDADNYEILQRNLQTEITAKTEGARIAQEQQASMFNSFAKLSKTAAVGYQAYKTEQDEITKQNDINMYFADADYRAKVDAAATGMVYQNSAVETEVSAERNAAELVAGNKVPVAEFTQNVNRLSIGQRIAFVRGQANTYAGYTTKFFSDVNGDVVIDGQKYKIRDVLADQQLYNRALTTVVRPGFMQEKGLNRFSVEALSPGLATMRQVENQLVTAVGNQQIAKVKSDTLAQAEGLLNTLKGEELRAQLPSIIANMNWSNDFNYPQTRKQVKTLLMGMNGAEPIIAEGTPEYKLLIETPIFKGEGGKMFALKDYPGEMAEIKRSRRQGFVNEMALQGREAQAKADQFWVTPDDTGLAPYQKFDAAVEQINSGSLSESEKYLQLQQLVNSTQSEIDANSGGYNVSPGNFATRSAAALDKANESKERYQDEAIRDGEVDEALINAEPDPARRKVLEEAYEEQQKNRYGPQYRETMEANEQRAQLLTGYNAAGKVDPKYKNSFTGAVERQLNEDYRMRFLLEKRSGDSDGQAALDAGAYIDQMVKDGMANKPDARYRRSIAQGNANQRVIGFPGLNLGGSPVSTPAQLRNYHQSWTSKITQPESLLTGIQLRHLSDTFYDANGGFVVPKVVTDLQNKIRESQADLPADQRQVPTTEELINRQIKAYNDQPNIPDSMNIRSLKPNRAEEFIEQQSPYVQNIMRDYPNLSTVRFSRAYAATPEGAYILQESNRIPEWQGDHGKPLPENAESTREDWMKFPPDQRAYDLVNQLGNKKFNYRGGPIPGNPNGAIFSGYYNSPSSLSRLNDWFNKNANTLGIKEVLYGVPGHMDSLTVTFE